MSTQTSLAQSFLTIIIIKCPHKLVLLNLFWLVLLLNVPQTSLAQSFLTSIIIKCPTN